MRSKTCVFVATVILLGTFGAANALATDNEPGCQRVQGYLEETLVTTGCTSAVGLCTVARMFGTLKGEAPSNGESVHANLSAIEARWVYDAERQLTRISRSSTCSGLPSRSR
jgi:hypothetical protein